MCVCVIVQVYAEVGRADLTPGGFGGVRLGPHGFGTGAGSMGNMLGPRHPAFGPLMLLLFRGYASRMLGAKCTNSKRECGSV